MEQNHTVRNNYFLYEHRARWRRSKTGRQIKGTDMIWSDQGYSRCLHQHPHSVEAAGQCYPLGTGLSTKGIRKDQGGKELGSVFPTCNGSRAAECRPQRAVWERAGCTSSMTPTLKTAASNSPFCQCSLLHGNKGNLQTCDLKKASSKDTEVFPFASLQIMGGSYHSEIKSSRRPPAETPPVIYKLPLNIYGHYSSFLCYLQPQDFLRRLHISSLSERFKRRKKLTILISQKLSQAGEEKSCCCPSRVAHSKRIIRVSQSTHIASHGGVPNPRYLCHPT